MLEGEMMNEHNFNEVRLNESLLKISKLQAIDQGDLEISYSKITEGVATALSIERVSLWFYNDQHTAITCAKLYEKKDNKYSEGLELKAKDFPGYFKYLSEERALLADDARTDPVTEGFLESYLRPLDIYSMLDAPIRVNGKMIGVICSEKTGEQRVWDQNDALFLGNIADIIARAIQARERRIALENLKENNENLEKLILERTLELEKQRASAEQSSKMALLGQMAGSIAHEINNPLTIILGLIKRLKMMDESDKPTKESRLLAYSRVEETTLRIVDIVKGLRFFARDASKDDFKEEYLNQIVMETLSLCRHQLKLTGCKLIVEGISESMKVRCQSVAISQALLNLINNSYDAIKDQDEKWIRISCSEKEGNYVLMIEDSGEKIPEDLRDKIMQPFFTTKPVGAGTGLGLSIVKGIIESHEGSFYLDEKVTHTNFVITLPKLT